MKKKKQGFVKFSYNSVEVLLGKDPRNLNFNLATTKLTKRKQGRQALSRHKRRQKNNNLKKKKFKSPETTLNNICSNKFKENCLQNKKKTAISQQSQKSFLS